jgi:hypothetical protein
MRNNYLKYILSLFVIMLVTWTISCSGKSGKTAGKPVVEAGKTDEVAARLIKMIAPAENSEFRLGDLHPGISSYLLHLTSLPAENQ